MSIHRVKEPFAGFDACPICHKKFSNIFALQQHIRSHTGEATEMTAEQLEAAEMKTDSMSPVSSMDFGMSGSEDQEEYQEEYRGSDMESALDLTPPLNKKGEYGRSYEDRESAINSQLIQNQHQSKAGGQSLTTNVCFTVNTELLFLKNCIFPSTPTNNALYIFKTFFPLPLACSS